LSLGAGGYSFFFSSGWAAFASPSAAGVAGLAASSEAYTVSVQDRKKSAGFTIGMANRKNKRNRAVKDRLFAIGISLLTTEDNLISSYSFAVNLITQQPETALIELKHYPLNISDNP